MRKTLKIALAAAALASSQAFAADVSAPFEATEFDRIPPYVVIKAPADSDARMTINTWTFPESYAR
ncbi:MAG: hypothetical protein A3D95_08620 [Betaproteobacteria bacterium RIFCSPHIGHO2_12_FULL_69_13]|nr:MAG: hypothetical protein A3D95_08620 [Betaproteobacteria bacterium RIFCSPHIGHO2_12_FULL_69_13]OGA65876.1 MAG: hypothetical protein A3G83_01850 [Betaproteobacteria bacterium RIFCSPLOWO2_12_FULL_68_20]